MSAITMVFRELRFAAVVLGLGSPALAQAQLQVYWCAGTTDRAQSRCLVARYIAAVASADRAPDLSAALDKWTKSLSPSAASDVAYVTSAREKIFREGANALENSGAADSANASQATIATGMALNILADVEASFHRSFVDVLNGNVSTPGAQADSMAKWRLKRDDATRLLIVAAGAVQATLVKQSKVGGPFDMLTMTRSQRDTLAAFMRSSFPSLKELGPVSSDLRYGPQMILKMVTDTAWKSMTK